jgi:hypothetical protein
LDFVLISTLGQYTLAGKLTFTDKTNGGRKGFEKGEFWSYENEAEVVDPA